ncbi:alpha/beta fold hydrolase [Pseudoxanthomonas dokdonensis]|uniref:AB hydrolase-1 domain-containing protein n=1 Tax=Pseudoxanthomonas dokdonensis TaxID=344882 RepID=A0A0R0CNH9_9GAMM|nr:alpha/beta fold hydrolase [Pseudoxanthomonas dokdonensis]KRG71565.1 hypothetical protein ABB29_02005 [Pseudoxanthomonas dokdonensis]
MSWIVSHARGPGLALACALAASSCASLADRIVNPPVSAATLSAADMLELPRDEIRTVQGNRISYYTVTPGDYAIKNRFSRQADSFELKVNIERLQPARVTATRGTVIYLHGWGTDASSLLPWSVALSESGYRGIVVDLRNHGHSDPAPLGFGLREAQDLAQLIPQWRQQGLIQEPLFLFGHSMGATTALFLADLITAQPPAGVIAFAPYANAGQAVPQFLERTLQDRHTPALARWWYDPARIQRGLVETQQRLDLQLSSVDVSDAVATTPVCTLILHGAGDLLVPAAESQPLGAANPRVQHISLPLDNHVSAIARMGWLRDPLASWMAAAAQDSDCAALDAGPDPSQLPANAAP